MAESAPSFFLPWAHRKIYFFLCKGVWSILWTIVSVHFRNTRNNWNTRHPSQCLVLVFFSSGLPYPNVSSIYYILILKQRITHGTIFFFFFFWSWRQSLLLHSMETKWESNLCKLHVLFWLNHVAFTHSNESLGIKWTVTMNGESTSGLCFSRIISTCCISFWAGTTRGETLLSASLYLRDCSSWDFHWSRILLTAGAEGGASWAVIKAVSHSSQILAT